MNKYEIAAQAQIELDEENKKLHASEQTLKEYYSQNPSAYLIEHLDVKPEHINWDLIPAYKNHKYHGTPNPLKKIIDFIAGWKWVGVESAKAVSKTWLAARIVLWFLDCFENSLIVTIAPKEDQLTLHIWREISLIYSKFGKGKLTKLKLTMTDDDTWLAVGFVAGSGTVEEAAQRAAGFHAPHMLTIFEETPGINQKLIDTMMSQSSAPHNLILALGNPDHQLDNLHRFCSLSNVEHIRISGFDFPNVVLDDANYIPGAQSKIGLERLLTQYHSVDNPLYQSHAEGESPSESIHSLIKKEWIKKAVKNFESLLDFKGKPKLEEIGGDDALGIDVANSDAGDEAAICKGKGSVCLEINSFPCPNANKLGHLIAQKCKDEEIKKDKIKVDGIGVGAGTVNTLIESGLNKDDINFIASESPLDKNKLDIAEEFNNKRSQAWWMVREALRTEHMAIIEDSELIIDLITPQWTINNGKICVEGKKEIKKRIGRSPNKGDAFVMWYWNNVVKPVEYFIQM